MHFHRPRVPRCLLLTISNTAPCTQVLTAIIEIDVKRGKSNISTLQGHVKSWPMSRTTQVLRYCRDWNTRARNSHVAMLTVKAIVSSIPAQKLAAADGVPELMAGIMPYAERHFKRLDKLYTSSYLIDYTLLSMGNLDDSVAGDYSAWEANSKLVLPPSQVEGKTQVGGSVVVGKAANTKKDEVSEEKADEVITVGESESESSSESDEDE